MPDLDETGLVGLLVGFGRDLRDAGVPVGPGDLVEYSRAAAVLDPADLLDLYWAGRATLVSRVDQIPVYHRIFERYFLDAPDPDGRDRSPFTPQARTEARAALQVPESDPATGSHGEQEALLGLMASDAETLRNKAFSACTTEELAAVRRMMRQLRLAPPRRRTRRTVRARRGPHPDLRRTARETMRMHGEPGELHWRRRKLRLRPLVLILDVSGSMADYSRNLLQFAYSTRRAAARVEVYCFGTRLTRITKELQHRRPDEALDRAARAVFDWDGGTRIGDALAAFVRDHGRRGVGRGGIVVICSDGLDRGDPAVLAQAMERLRRQCRRIVWMNPHKGDDPDFQPSTLGMIVAAP